MQFDITYNGKTYTKDAAKAIAQLIALDIPHAIHFEETGLYISLISLSTGESLTLEDENGENVTVTRIA